jgi:hypothetical protein
MTARGLRAAPPPGEFAFGARVVDDGSAEVRVQGAELEGNFYASLCTLTSALL